MIRACGGRISARTIEVGAGECRSSEAVRARGSAPRSPLGQPRRLAGVPSTATRPWVRGSGWYAKGSCTGHFVMFILSYKARAAYGGCTWEAAGPVQGLCGQLCGRPPRQTRRPVRPVRPCLQDCQRTQHRLHDNMLDLAEILPPHALGRAPFLQPRPDEPIRRMDGIQRRYASV